MMMQMARSPGWTKALWKNGIPRFATLRHYAGANPSINDVISVRAPRDGRRLHLGRSRAIPRPLEADA